jgi:hypothetical protein
MEQFLSFNIGQVVQTLIIVAGGFMALGTMRSEIRYQGQRLLLLDNKIDKLEAAFVQLARQDERMNAMDQRMLSQGRRIDWMQNRATRTPEKETD